MNIFENNPAILFFLGMMVTLLVGVVVYIIIKNNKHRCACGGQTRKICKMWLLEKLISGTFLYEVYVFYKCKKCPRTPEIKFFVKAYSPWEIGQKPRDQFDFGNSETQQLFSAVGLPMPVEKHPSLKGVIDKVLHHFPRSKQYRKGPYRSYHRPIYRN